MLDRSATQKQPSIRKFIYNNKKFDSNILRSPGYQKWLVEPVLTSQKVRCLKYATRHASSDKVASQRSFQKHKKYAFP
jgi:hypothetical protein